MPRQPRRAGLLLTAATAAVTVASTCTPASAAPATPSFGRVIEGLASYDGQSTCSPTAKPGATALRSLLMAAYRSTGDLGIVRACSIGGTSEHKEGRAWDWAVNVSNTTQEAAAQNFFAWVLATDTYGNKYAMARRLGIMYMIHNRKIWSAYNSSAGWRPYTGANAHVDHVHFSLSRVGGAKTTTYWSPAKSGTPTSGTAPAPVPVTTVPATRPAPSPSRSILRKWAALGGSAVVGPATSGMYAVPGGYGRNFTHGRILWSTGYGAHYVHGSILNEFVRAGGVRVVGMPRTDETLVTGGKASAFTRGRILYSRLTDAHFVHGPILARFDAAGGVAVVGLPRTDETAVTGGRASTFTRGRILWSTATGAHLVRGPILDRYTAAGGPAALGLPTTEEASVVGGRAGTFTKGRILWSTATGAHVIRGAIAEKYDALGGPATLGLPTTDELAVDGGRSSVFQKGRVYWSTGTGAHVVRDAILTRYLSLNGPAGALGLPTSDAQPVRVGLQNDFESGSIVWVARSGRTYVR
jgi:uncharacterized protein with LGFP repeats